MINDNQCVKFLLSRRLAGRKQTLVVNQCHQAGPETVNCVQLNQTSVRTDFKDLSANKKIAESNVVTDAHIVQGQPQKKGRSAVVRQRQSLKYVNNVFYCVNTSYPMDNSLSGRRRPARQKSEKDVLCLHQQVGP